MYRSGAVSLLIHALLAVALFTLSPIRRRIVPHAPFSARDVLTLYRPPESAKPHQGGGGGGQRSPLPASFGRLPKPAPRQFVPPLVVPENPAPKLVMEPSIVVPSGVALPQVSAFRFGDPQGAPGPPSGGPGSGGGIGAGRDGGVGPGDGPGFGPGSGGGITAIPAPRGAFVGPVLVFKIEPEYTDDARKARIQGLVLLRCDVGADGRTYNARIERGLGLGLDERALEAVAKWRFRPALRGGVAVAVPAVIEVRFHLL